MPKAVWGIDVSKNSIKAVKLAEGKAGPQLLAIDVVEFKKGGEDVDPEEQIRGGLTAFLSRNRVKGEQLACSLPGHATFNRFIKLPPVEAKRIPEIVRYEAQQHIPFPLDEVIWDYQKVERRYELGEEMEVVLFAIKRDLVSQFLVNLTMAQMSVDILQFAPVALYNFMIFDQDVSEAAMVLDMGADNTDLLIVDGHKFWIRNLPIAGNDLTKALSQKFRIPFREAEKLKLGAAKSPQAAKIFGVIQPVLRDLTGEIHRSIGYYKSMSRSARIGTLVLTGSSAKTINLQKFLSKNLQLGVRRLSKLNRIAPAASVNQALYQRYLPSLGVAIGLGLQGLERASTRVNLLPPELLQKKEIKKKQPWAIAAAAILGVSVVVSYLGGSGEVDRLQKQVDDSRKVLSDVDNVQFALTSARNTQQVESEILKFADIAPDRDLSVRVLNVISDVLPYPEAAEGATFTLPPNYKKDYPELSAEDPEAREQAQEELWEDYQKALRSRIFLLSVEAEELYYEVAQPGAEPAPPTHGRRREEETPKQYRPYLRVTAVVGCLQREDVTADAIGAESDSFIRAQAKEVDEALKALKPPVAFRGAGDTTHQVEKIDDEAVEQLLPPEEKKDDRRRPPSHIFEPPETSGLKYFRFRVWWEFKMGAEAQEEEAGSGTPPAG